MARSATDPGRPMASWEFGKHLVAAGILSQEELNRTRRVIIDATSGELVRMRPTAPAGLLPVIRSSGLARPILPGDGAQRRTGRCFAISPDSFTRRIRPAAARAGGSTMQEIGPSAYQTPSSL